MEKTRNVIDLMMLGIDVELVARAANTAKAECLTFETWLGKAVRNNGATREPRTKLTIKEVAAEFRVGVRTVERWMQRGWIPYRKIDLVVRFDLEEVNEMMRAKFGQNRLKRF